MNLRDTALTAYYYGSLPLRWLQSSTGASPVSILFYHRVSDRHANDWTMSCDMFQQQMDHLQQHYQLVTLQQAQQLLNGQATFAKPAVCVTFDDGYADNVDFALPLIIDRQIPCTYFVSQHHVATGEPFAHDVARDCPLPPNTIAELRDMSEAGIEIGSHTRNHVDLGTVTNTNVLYDEVISAGIELGGAIGQRIRYFAFPFGLHRNLHPLAFAMCQAAGYEGVCSAYGGYNFAGDDAFHLQRIHADGCMIRLKNWLSVDPRKLRLVERYEYRGDSSFQAWISRSAALRDHRAGMPFPSASAVHGSTAPLPPTAAQG
jgi:peptidoglycan/xylan/chitin deacetylase (PgdA/CDA1 family)